jgi:hypothetical protein
MDSVGTVIFCWNLLGRIQMVFQKKFIRVGTLKVFRKELGHSIKK